MKQAKTASPIFLIGSFRISTPPLLRLLAFQWPSSVTEIVLLPPAPSATDSVTASSCQTREYFPAQTGLYPSSVTMRSFGQIRNGLTRSYKTTCPEIKLTFSIITMVWAPSGEVKLWYSSHPSKKIQRRFPHNNRKAAPAVITASITLFFRAFSVPR